MKIISGEGNDRLNYGWLAVFRCTCPVCCLQEEGLWVQWDGEHRPHAAPEASMAQMCPKAEHIKAEVGTLTIPTGPSLSERDRKLSSSSTEAFGDAGCVVLLVPVVGKGMSREGCCLLLVPSACALVICSYAAVYQTHPCNLIFCICVCLFLYITSSSFLFQLIIIILKHLCCFCSMWIFARAYWTL